MKSWQCSPVRTSEQVLESLSNDAFASKLRAVLVNFVLIEFTYARTTFLSFIQERANP